MTVHGSCGEITEAGCKGFWVELIFDSIGEHRVSTVAAADTVRQDNAQYNSAGHVGLRERAITLLSAKNCDNHRIKEVWPALGGSAHSLPCHSDREG